MLPISKKIQSNKVHIKESLLTFDENTLSIKILKGCFIYDERESSYSTKYATKRA